MPKAREGDVNAFVGKFTGYGFNDLCSLPDLKKDKILANLKKRFVGEIVYTYVGDIVVSTNPFKDVGCVGKAIRSKYKSPKGKAADHTKLPPHIYALVDATFRQMMENSLSQSVLISGESVRSSPCPRSCCACPEWAGV
jgi:myosin-1